MVHSIKLGGKTRKLLFGNYVFKKLKDEHQITLADIGRFFGEAVRISQDIQGGDTEMAEAPDFTIIYPMVYHALRAAEIYSNDPNPDEYDVDKVCVWMDMEPGSLMAMIPHVADSLTNLSAGANQEDAAKKKRKI